MTVDWGVRAAQLRPEVCQLIGGERKAGSSEQIVKLGPRDGRHLYSFAAAGLQDIDAAVTAARGSVRDGRWSQLAPSRRREALHRLADLIERDREALALLECLDVGKPIFDAFEADVPSAVSALRYWGDATDKLVGKLYGADAKGLSYELIRPIGVVGAIVGWNFPLTLAIGKIGPALAAGNSLILKPSELTSLSASWLGGLALEAGIPDGVLNIVCGGGSLGDIIARHPDVDLVSFTGSSAVGKHLQVAAGQSNMKRLILECGGKAPNIVFDDSIALEAVADGIIRQAFRNQGQVCTASSRLLVHRKVHDSLLQRLVERAAILVPGDPLDASTRFAALVSDGHRRKVQKYIEQGRCEGARTVLEVTSPVPVDGGYYVGPVIFDCVDPESTIAREEIFGPVLSVLSFEDEDEAAALANATIYGLSAILWTRDSGRAQRMSREIDAGWIIVNATESPSGSPVGLTIGGHKQSGIGAEGGVDGLKLYTRSSAVQILV